MVAILGFSREKIIAAVQDMYTEVATTPTRHFHFPVGRKAAAEARYPDRLLSTVPDSVLDSFAGVGCPFIAESIRPGDRVLDIGAGSGTDALIAARLVGPTGKVWALDVTPAMADKLRHHTAELGIGNVEVIEGNAEQIPLGDASVDVITSNGVLNLVPDKRRAMAEMRRVLRPGGRVQIADIVIGLPVTPDCESDPRLWAECVVGATIEEDYLQWFRDAGFEDLRVLRRYDYFSASPSEETREIAARFNAHGVELAMRRAEVAPSAALQWARRWNSYRAWVAVRRRGWLGLAALAAAVLACYGTLAALVLLSAAGLAVEVDPAIWGGVIIGFAIAAAIAVAAGVRRHHAVAPAVAAVAGALLVTYVQTIDYDLVIELAGFGLLAIGVALDLRHRRVTPNPPIRHSREPV